MRYLTNHALTAEELYLGCNEKMCSKPNYYFYNHFNVELDNRHCYFGHILIYAFDLITTRVITNKERFTGPMGLFYIDIETYNEDLFLKLRRKGKFQDIDIVQSDFKGYQLAFYYSSGKSKYTKKHNIYTAEKHNNLINERINSGEVMYNIKNFTIYSIIAEVAEWAGLSYTETKRILHTGFMKMYHAVKRGCYITLKAIRSLEVMFFIGRFYSEIPRQINDYFFRSKMKFLRLWFWGKEEFKDDYFYIGLDKNLMVPNFTSLNDGPRLKARVWVSFGYFTARRQLDLLLRNSVNMYIFKVKLHKKHRRRINVYFEEAKFHGNDIEYIGRGINYTFYPEDKHWKEIIIEFRNEEGNSE